MRLHRDTRPSAGEEETLLLDTDAHGSIEETVTRISVFPELRALPGQLPNQACLLSTTCSQPRATNGSGSACETGRHHLLISSGCDGHLGRERDGEGASWDSLEVRTRKAEETRLSRSAAACGLAGRDAASLGPEISPSLPFPCTGCVSLEAQGVSPSLIFKNRPPKGAAFLAEATQGASVSRGCRLVRLRFVRSAEKSRKGTSARRAGLRQPSPFPRDPTPCNPLPFLTWDPGRCFYLHKMGFPDLAPEMRVWLGVEGGPGPP